VAQRRLLSSPGSTPFLWDSTAPPASSLLHCATPLRRPDLPTPAVSATPSRLYELARTQRIDTTPWPPMMAIHVREQWNWTAEDNLPFCVGVYFLNWNSSSFLQTMGLFTRLIIRLFQLVFLARTVFLSQQNQSTVFFNRLISTAERGECLKATWVLACGPHM
jgi:hypothetical protein